MSAVKSLHAAIVAYVDAQVHCPTAKDRAAFISVIEDAHKEEAHTAFDFSLAEAAIEDIQSDIMDQAYADHYDDDYDSDYYY